MLSMLILNHNSGNVTTQYFILTGMTAIPTLLNKSHSVIIKVLLKHIVSPHGGDVSSWSVKTLTINIAARYPGKLNISDQ